MKVVTVFAGERFAEYLFSEIVKMTSSWFSILCLPCDYIVLFDRFL